MIWRGDGTNRVCKSLLTLFDQVDAHYPGRDKSNDGTVGDTSHQARKSDHNPDEHSIVRALDITHDPARGFDSYKFADFLREHWDDRVQYLISNKRIANIDVGAKAWRPYNGENPHDHHVHVSARGDDRADDPRPWDLAAWFGDAAPAPPVVALPVVPLDQRAIDAVVAAAGASDLAHHSWNNGRAPLGYVQGLAVTYGQVLRRLAAGDGVSHAMVRIVNGQYDVFDHYAAILTAAGMGTSNATNVDRLRSLFVILTGLGMRESSGGIDIGRDTSASNTSADSAEAGTWQQSWDSHSTSPELPKLLAAYEGTAPDAVDAIFKHGITLHAGALENSGDPDSDGYKFQALAKARPSIAALFAAIGLRTLRTHWGPINRREAEVVPAADALFRQVQEIVNVIPATQGVPHVAEPTTDQPQPAPTPTLPALPLPKLDVLQGLHYIVSGDRDKVREDLKLFLDVFNSKHADVPIALPPSTAATPDSTPTHKTLAFQLGGVGGLITAIAHLVGGLDPNLTLLGFAVSAGTAFLGPAGGVVGTIIMNLARAAWNAVPTTPPQAPK